MSTSPIKSIVKNATEMKLIESKATYLPQDKGLEGVYKQIEIAGRTCYKSEDKITKDSAEKFFDRMYRSNHTAMLEHGTVYLQRELNYADDKLNVLEYKYSYNPYSKVRYDGANIYITTNMRVIVENLWLTDLQYICEPTDYHEKRYTMKFITDRGVSHELVRHRVFSFAQESTRYCNYSKGKFSKEITFMIPSWYKDIDYHTDEYLYNHLYAAEQGYMYMIDNGFTPQQARQLLPNALKTEIVMTGFASDWKRLLRLRLFEETGKVHPDMKVLMEKLKTECIKNEIWDDIINSDCK